MTERIIKDSNGRKHITNEPQLHAPQRTWIGLTDEQMRQICGSVATMREAVREAEAILKEGNK